MSRVRAFQFYTACMARRDNDMEWLNLQPHGLALYLAETPKLDYVVIFGQGLAEYRDALAKAGFRIPENRPDLATRRVELDPDGAFLPGQARMLEDLHAALPRAKFASFSDASHRRPQDGVTPEDLLSRRATASGMPTSHPDVVFSGGIDEEADSHVLMIDRWKGRYRFTVGRDGWRGEEMLVTDDLARGLQACVAVLSEDTGMKLGPKRFEQALDRVAPHEPGQVLATFSGTGHAIRLTAVDDGYALRAVTAFGEHDLMQGADLDDVLRVVPGLAARRRPMPASLREMEGPKSTP